MGSERPGLQIEPGKTRRYPRRQFHNKVGILCDGRYWVGQSLEISESGISFVFMQKFELGKLMVLNFQLPGGHFVSVQGEVKNYQEQKKLGFTHGLQFKTLKIDSRRFVRQFVAAQF